jgi:hypothetical protein
MSIAVDFRPRAHQMDPSRQLARIVPDRRMHRRVPVDIAGRFMREDKEDHACRIVNMSAGGMALISATLCEVGEKIVVYLDALGRIEGIVVRQIEGGFAARIVAGPHKREKIVTTTRASPSSSPISRTRTASPFPSADPRVACEGEHLLCICSQVP